MPRKGDVDPVVKEHSHLWVRNQDGITSRCANPYKGGKCKAIRVSPEEYQRRQQEWDSYFTLCRTTPAYQDYLLMCEAFTSKNKPQIQEIMTRIKERTFTKENEYGDEVIELKDPLPTPECADPYNPKNIYVVERYA